MIRTRVCEVFGIDIPILNAPMASAGGELAAAVSAASGLRFIADPAPYMPAARAGVETLTADAEARGYRSA
jgi:NAD(P)H-dependent flavin oxidoreductase YrpB (nitropropane dioxygenase family)